MQLYNNNNNNYKFCQLLRLTITYWHVIGPFVHQTSPGVFLTNHVIPAMKALMKFFIMRWKHLITTTPIREDDISFSILTHTPLKKNITLSPSWLVYKQYTISKCFIMDYYIVLRILYYLFIYLTISVKPV